MSDQKDNQHTENQKILERNETERILIRKELNEIFNELKEYHSKTQGEFFEWLRDFKGIQEGFSTSQISNCKTGANKNLSTLRKLQRYVREYRNYIESTNKKDIQISNQKESLTNRTRQREVTSNFIQKHLQPKDNVLDVMGIQNSDIRSYLEGLLREQNIPKIEGRILILSPNGEGARMRAILEDKELEKYKRGTLQASIDDWEKIVQNNHEKSITLTVKQYSFTPTHKIIRINDHILVSPYLNMKGYFSPYTIYSKKRDSFKFSAYLQHFEAIYSLKQYNQKNKISFDITNHSFPLRSVGVVEAFIIKAIQKFQSANEIIEIDCVGVMLSSVRKTLLSLMENNSLPTIHIRLLPCDPDEHGIETRVILEKVPSLQESARSNIEKMSQLRKTLGEYNDSKIEIRLLTPPPSIYIIRINSLVFSSPYYAKKGALSTYSTYDGQDKSPFSYKIYEQSLHLFERYFTDERLSKPLPE